MGLRAPVAITKHGRPHMTFVDAGYFERLEEIAAGNILAALDRKHIASADMPDDVAALIASQIPSEDEIASGKWKNGRYPFSGSRRTYQLCVSLPPSGSTSRRTREGTAHRC